MARGQGQPLIINNNVSSSASAAAAANTGGYRKSFLRSFIRYVGVTLGLLVGGGIMEAAGAKDFGLFLVGIGTLLLVVGVPTYLIRGVWRILFG